MRLEREAPRGMGSRKPENGQELETNLYKQASLSVSSPVLTVRDDFGLIGKVVEVSTVEAIIVRRSQAKRVPFGGS